MGKMPSEMEGLVLQEYVPSLGKSAWQGFTDLAHCSNKNYIQTYILGNNTKRATNYIVYSVNTRQALGR